MRKKQVDLKTKIPSIKSNQLRKNFDLDEKRKKFKFYRSN